MFTQQGKQLATDLKLSACASEGAAAVDALLVQHLIDTADLAAATYSHAHYGATVAVC